MFCSLAVGFEEELGDTDPMPKSKRGFFVIVGLRWWLKILVLTLGQENSDFTGRKFGNC